MLPQHDHVERAIAVLDSRAELQARVKALQMELDDMKLDNRSKENVMTRELDTRRGTIQEFAKAVETAKVT